MLSVMKYGRRAGILFIALHLSCSSSDETERPPDLGAPAQRLFVSAKEGSSLHVFDLASLEPLREIPVDEGPGEVHTDRDGSVVFTVSGKKNSVTFVNPETLEVVRKVKVGASPVHSFLEPGGASLWVGNDASGDVSIIDLATFAERKVLTGNGHHKMAFATDVSGALRATYVSNIVDGTISVVDRDGRAEGNVAGVGRSPHGMDFSALTRAVYNCSGADEPAVEVIPVEGDDADRVARTIPLEARCSYLHISADGGEALVTVPSAGKLARIMLETEDSASYEIGAWPDRFERDGDRVYVALVGEPAVAVVDFGTGEVRKIAVGRAVDPSGDGTGHRNLRLFEDRLFVSNAFDGTVSVIDTTKGEVIRTLSGVESPSGIAVAGPRGGTPYPR